MSDSLKSTFSNSFHLLMSLSKREFKVRYADSLFGMAWAIINPIALMVVMWGVFTFGLKINATYRSVDFIPWFFVGLTAWNYIAECMIQTCGAVLDSAFLVKKVQFDLKIQVLVKILAATFLHIVFILILVAVAVAYNFMPSVYWLQLPYYWLAISLFLYGFGLIVSSLNVFFRDTTHVVLILSQIFFWGTPIVWDPEILPKKYHLFLNLNPFYYAVEGYRDALFNRAFFWENTTGFTIFWVMTISVLAIGTMVFNKLSPHYADVV